MESERKQNEMFLKNGEKRHEKANEKREQKRILWQSKESKIYESNTEFGLRT